MNSELERIAHRLSQAAKPEDVFGDIGNSLLVLRRVYHALAKVTHPDVYPDLEEKILAQTVFMQLVRWFEWAEQKVQAGRYGGRELITLQTKTRQYELDGSFAEHGKYNDYPCEFFEHGRLHQATLRMVRDPRDGDLLRKEVRILNILLTSAEAGKFAPYLPSLLEAFLYEDGTTSRQAVIFEREAGWYSLEQVHQVYPRGIDPKDMAWMWRRLLVVLGFAHANAVIHGAVLPGNVWIQPEQHGLMLMNWTHAVHDPGRSAETIERIEPAFASWYPQEILKHDVPTFGTDISMSAKCMIYLLGGDVERERIPNTVPHPMSMFLKGSILPGKRTPQDAWALKHEFDDLLHRLWGKRTFHPFQMSFTH